MESVFLKLVNMSITVSWLVLAIILLRFTFRKMPKWVLCLLWGLVALRLICPFSLESALSLIPSAEPLPREIIYTAHPHIQSGIPMIDAAVNPVLESSLTPVTQAVSANPTQIWSFILSRIWFLGMTVMLLYAAVSFLLLKHQVRTAVPLERGIRQSETVVSPYVLGFLKPVIYLPFTIASEDLPYVIAHERAHIHRKDNWWKPIGFLLLSVYWFNPVLWIAYLLLCRDIEAACDERVIKDMEKEQLRAYSTALLNCSVHRRTISACPLAFGETGVKTRIQWIMNYRKPAFWVVLIALVVSIVVAVCFLTNPKSESVQSVEMVENLDFPGHNVVTWFNKYETVPDEVEYGEAMPLTGMEEVSLFYNRNAGTLRIMTPTNTQELFSGIIVRNLFLSDLNGDGVSEICATIFPEHMDRIYILDYANDQTYELIDTPEHFYRLTVREDTLFVLQYDTYWNVTGYGHPVLKDGTIEIAPLQEGYRHLTETVTCVDINNRKMVCLSRQEDIDIICSILEDISTNQQSIPTQQWKDYALNSAWNVNTIGINYELGQETLYFSGDYSIYWNALENVAYRVADPEPLKALVSEVTNGVIKRAVSGVPFATMDTPWDWCKNITSDAVATAQLEVTYKATSTGSTGTNGVMSEKTLDQFIQILDAIPKSSITSYESLEKQSFRSFVSGPQTISSGISILDGVNSLAAGFVYYNGEVHMVLTEETDQLDRGNFLCMTSYRLYKVEDPALTEYMKRLIEYTPVITYSVGAEYSWQKPLSFTFDGFSLELNLIEDWEYEYVTMSDSSGVRIRPKGETTGWLYFSYWPNDYRPVETDRYINEGMSYGYPSYTSYPSSVKTPTTFSTYHVAWSYRRYDLETGDFAIINDGADPWFLQYEDQIDCIYSLSRIQFDS